MFGKYIFKGNNEIFQKLKTAITNYHKSRLYIIKILTAVDLECGAYWWLWNSSHLSSWLQLVLALGLPSLKIGALVYLHTATVLND